MNFSSIFQLRTKKFWWMDVIFYFVISSLVATVLCYVIFLIKNNIQEKDIQKEIVALQTVGTSSQKEQEKEVISYQKKINDFAGLFKNHQFISQILYFMQQETMPNIWFKSFNVDEKNTVINLPGEADDAAAFSRQIAVFEKNEYIKNINVLNYTVGQSSKIEFNIDITLDPKIFNYIADMNPASAAAAPPPATLTQTNQKSSEKLITVFDFIQPFEAVGIIDQNNHTIELDVPFGSDITNLTPSVVISPKATVSPATLQKQDFTAPIVYKVTAEDNSVQNYTVTVKVLPKEAVKTSQSGFGVIITIILLIFAVVGVVLGAFFIYKKRQKAKQQIQQ
jgi:hypothetical protein